MTEPMEEERLQDILKLLADGDTDLYTDGPDIIHELVVELERHRETLRMIKNTTGYPGEFEGDVMLLLRERHPELFEETK